MATTVAKSACDKAMQEMQQLDDSSSNMMTKLVVVK
jgi:hypothetical protein